ncbi:FHA domain-containing protein [Sorangium sp. So ce1099]|uniref:FHA domain-containing protein n=1 Tax=Sorangium sp. So ce1099 TaxID=3133331 RepID=UPI003F5F5366
MALLIQAGGSRGVALAAHCLVGRSSACALRLDDPLASAEHARLSFASGAWSVRDLGSRNGTWLNDERLDPGTTRPLSAGDRLAFGNLAAAWSLADASPPVAMARRLATGAVLAAADGVMLALPSPAALAACVFEGRGGAWIAEVDGEARPVHDGEVLHVAGEPFMLHLPVAQVATLDANAARPRLDEVALALRVSRDEDHVEVSVALPRGAHVLPPRAHHYTLLTLARARLRDRGAPSLAEPQRGWRFVDELCRSLAMEESRLNVEIYRIRQDFAALGLHDATGVVERRRGSRQVRLGTAQVAIDVMG